MKAKVTHTFTRNQRVFRAGQIVELTVEEYNDVQSAAHGAGAVFPLTPVFYEKDKQRSAYEAYELLESYLDEKGVDFYLGQSGMKHEAGYVNVLHIVDLHLKNVPPKLYHEVVVPGLIHTLRCLGITYKGNKHLYMTLKYQPKKVRVDLSDMSTVMWE